MSVQPTDDRMSQFRDETEETETLTPRDGQTPSASPFNILADLDHYVTEWIEENIKSNRADESL